MRSSSAQVTTAAEGLPRRRFTVAEVEAMFAAGVMEEDERVELIGGELVPMSPKGSQHEVLKTALLDRWYRLRPDQGNRIWKNRLQGGERRILGKASIWDGGHRDGGVFRDIFAG